MLNVRSVKQLAGILGSTAEELLVGLSDLDRYCKTFILVDPEKPHKLREVISISGRWRGYLDRLYQRLLLPKLTPSLSSHGGVRGKSIKTNASCHRGSVYGLTLDISNFFPTIHYKRIYKLFV